MKRNCQILVIILFLLFPFGKFLFCSDTTEEILPLKIGNEWIENICRYNSNADVNCHKRITKVIADTLINSEKFYVLEVSDSTGKVQARNYYVNESDGLYIFNNDRFVMILKYPVQAGEIFKGATDSVKVDSIDVTVQISGKNYNCIKYSIEKTNIVYYKMFIYCSPGIGRVVYEIYDLNDGKNKLAEKWELLDFKIK